jgi:hypothetical protein
MNTYKTYISFVIQKGELHKHDFEIANLELPKFNFYSDNTSQEVLRWAEERQKKLQPDEKIIILNYFNISNIK